MKKIYNIPVYKDAERLSAYLEGNLSKEERRQMELDIQNDSELAELAIDDISVDWDADISDDYPDFDWQNDGELDELIDLFDANEPNDPFEFDDEDLEDIIDDDEIESVLDEKQEDVDGIGDEDYIDNTDDQDDDDDPSDDDETDLDDDY
jgi:hypothetical protein